jgi:hypothetical protein
MIYFVYVNFFNKLAKSANYYKELETFFSYSCCLQFVLHLNLIILFITKSEKKASADNAQIVKQIYYVLTIKNCEFKLKYKVFGKDRFFLFM